MYPSVLIACLLQLKYSDTSLFQYAIHLTSYVDSGELGPLARLQPCFAQLSDSPDLQFACVLAFALGCCGWLMYRISRAYMVLYSNHFICLNREVVSLLTRVSLILADTIVIAITWIKMYGLARDSFHLQIRTSMSTVMFTDGAYTFTCVVKLVLAECVCRQLVFYVSAGLRPDSQT